MGDPRETRKGKHTASCLNNCHSMLIKLAVPTVKAQYWPVVERELTSTTLFRHNVTSIRLIDETKEARPIEAQRIRYFLPEEGLVFVDRKECN